MRNAVVSDQPVNRPADFNLDTYIASGAFQFGEGTLQLKAWISADLADYLRESRLSEDQTLKADDDAYQLTATVSDSWQLRWWIRSQGAGIVVLEPVGLREEVLTGLREAAEKYLQSY